jgi:CDP-glucose 4,6-dehydratase
VEVVVEPDSGWPAELEILKLDSSKSQKFLGWHPKWDVKQAVDATVAWHQAHLEGQSMDEFCRMQIQQYLSEENGGTAP